MGVIQSTITNIDQLDSNDGYIFKTKGPNMTKNTSKKIYELYLIASEMITKQKFTDKNYNCKNLTFLTKKVMEKLDKREVQFLAQQMATNKETGKVENINKQLKEEILYGKAEDFAILNESGQYKKKERLCVALANYFNMFNDVYRTILNIINPVFYVYDGQETIPEEKLKDRINITEDEKKTLLQNEKDRRIKSRDKKYAQLYTMEDIANNPDLINDKNVLMLLEEANFVKYLLSRIQLSEVTDESGGNKGLFNIVRRAFSENDKKVSSTICTLQNSDGTSRNLVDFDVFRILERLYASYSVSSGNIESINSDFKFNPNEFGKQYKRDKKGELIRDSDRNPIIDETAYQLYELDSNGDPVKDANGNFVMKNPDEILELDKGKKLTEADKGKKLTDEELAQREVLPHYARQIRLDNENQMAEHARILYKAIHGGDIQREELSKITRLDQVKLDIMDKDYYNYLCTKKVSDTGEEVTGSNMGNKTIIIRRGFNNKQYNKLLQAMDKMRENNSKKNEIMVNFINKMFRKKRFPLLNKLGVPFTDQYEQKIIIQPLTFNDLLQLRRDVRTEAVKIYKQNLEDYVNVIKAYYELLQHTENTDTTLITNERGVNEAVPGANLKVEGIAEIEGVEKDVQQRLRRAQLEGIQRDVFAQQNLKQRDLFDKQLLEGNVPFISDDLKYKLQMKDLDEGKLPVHLGNVRRMREYQKGKYDDVLGVSSDDYVNKLQALEKQLRKEELDKIYKQRQERQAQIGKYQGNDDRNTNSLAPAFDEKENNFAARFDVKQPQQPQGNQQQPKGNQRQPQGNQRQPQGNQRQPQGKQTQEKSEDDRQAMDAFNTYRRKTGKGAFRDDTEEDVTDTGADLTSTDFDDKFTFVGTPAEEPTPPQDGIDKFIGAVSPEEIEIDESASAMEEDRRGISSLAGIGGLSDDEASDKEQDDSVKRAGGVKSGDELPTSVGGEIYEKEQEKADIPQLTEEALAQLSGRGRRRLSRQRIVPFRNSFRNIKSKIKKQLLS